MLNAATTWSKSSWNKSGEKKTNLKNKKIELNKIYTKVERVTLSKLSMLSESQLRHETQHTHFTRNKKRIVQLLQKHCQYTVEFICFCSSVWLKFGSHSLDLCIACNNVVHCDYIIFFCVFLSIPALYILFLVAVCYFSIPKHQPFVSYFETIFGCALTVPCINIM